LCFRKNEKEGTGCSEGTGGERGVEALPSTSIQCEELSLKNNYEQVKSP